MMQIGFRISDAKGNGGIDALNRKLLKSGYSAQQVKNAAELTVTEDDGSEGKYKIRDHVAFMMAILKDERRV